MSVSKDPTPQLKTDLLALRLEDPEAFKTLIEEVLSEAEQQSDQNSRESNLRKLIKSHFDRFSDVFERLA